MIILGARLLYYIFLVLGGGLLLISLSHLYHAIRFGGRDPLAIASTGLFIAGMAVIVWATLSLLVGVNWNHSFNLEIPAWHIGIPKT